MLLVELSKDKNWISTSLSKAYVRMLAHSSRTTSLRMSDRTNQMVTLTFATPPPVTYYLLS